MKKLLILVASAIALATAAVKAYDVGVYRNSLGIVEDGQVGVGEHFRMCVDSLTKVSVWVGDTFAGGRYYVEVRDSATDDVLAHSGNVRPVQSWSWVSFPLTQDLPLVRGRTCKVMVTRENGAAIEFAYAPDPDKYGGIILPQGDNQSIPLTYDLACRVEGLMDTITRFDFGAFCVLPGWDTLDTMGSRLNRDTWVDRAAVVGLGWGVIDAQWNVLQPRQDTVCDFYNFDEHVWRLTRSPYQPLHAQPAALLTCCPKWASTRVDSYPPNDDEIAWVYDTCIHCAPRNLWDENNNYWRTYLDSLLEHLDRDPRRDTLWRPCDSIHIWIIENEPNDTCWDVWSHPGVTGWWRRPNRDYLTGFDGLRGLCSLYVREAYVAKCRIKPPGDAWRQNDKILIGNMHRAVGRNSVLVGGVDWLRTCYEIALKDPGYVFWDGVAFHPYQEEHEGFNPEQYEANLDSIRAVMRAFGDGDGEVWNTEMGWNDISEPHNLTQEQDCRNVAEVLTAGKGSLTRPEGGYDKNCWWVFYRPAAWGCWGLVETSLARQQPFYSFKQTQEQLVGKRCNGRTLLGDARDDSVRIYEFENPADGNRKTWVAWVTDTLNKTELTVSAALPARADENDRTLLAYQSGGMSSQKSAGQNGWLQETLTTQPVFLSEPPVESISRPDLAVDSMRVRPLWPMVGRPCSLYAYLHDHGSRPVGSSATPLVQFRWNGDMIPSALVPMDTTHDAWAVSYVIDTVPPSMRGSGLFSADANPGQAFVELGMDDNVGYQKTTIRRQPEGDIEIASQDGHSNVPLVPVSLHSADCEKDSTGNTPCDSARFLVYSYDKNDTLVAAETTAWFSGSVTDTVVKLSLGEARYRIRYEVLDSAGSVSDTIGDAQHPVIVFDSTSATGTIEINSGARFTTTTACTLGLTASDAGSGVHAMRIGRAEPVQLVLNSGFSTASTHWEFSAAGLDSGGLGMAVLRVSPDSASWVRQDISADSVQPLLGDTVRLSADLLVSVPDTTGDSCGRLRLRYVYENHNSLVADSLVTVGSVGFTGGTQALCGLNSLSGAFKLPPLMTDTSWTWAAARVELTAGGPLAGDGSGTVWADNVTLTPSGPAPDYSWWTGFDSTRGCTLATGAGSHSVYFALLDTCGNETTTPLSDDIILDALAPMAHVSSPTNNGTVSGIVNITGWAFDSVKVIEDTWFMVRRLEYKGTSSSQWLPCAPDSCSGVPVYNTYGVGHLGYWSTLGISNGFYNLRLVALDSAGNATTHQITVKIQNGRSMAIFTGSGPAGGEVSLDAAGSDFVGSATGKVVSLSEELDSLAGFTLTDSGTPAYVAGITELDSSHILVADARSGDVSKMTRTGTEKQELISDLDLPVAVATDAGGNIWTLDKGTSQLTKHRPDGTQVLTIGGQGEDSTSLYYPEALTVKDPLVYIADTRNNRIAVYDTAGTLIRLITGDFRSPCAVVVTDSGQLYLVDKQSGTIEGINELGGHLVTIVQEDSAPLRQLALSDDGRSLVTLKTGSNDILKYEVVCSDSGGGGIQSGGTVLLPTRFIANQPWPNPMRTKLFISYAIPRQQRVTVRIYDIAGKLQRVITDKDHRPGYYNQVWDRTDSHGREVANGIYFIEVATPTDRDRKKVVLAR